MPRETTRALVNWARAQVQSPLGSFPVARFVYHNGRCAVWQEDKAAGKHYRVLYADSAILVRPATRREPFKVISGEEEWTIKKLPGGGG